MKGHVYKRGKNWSYLFNMEPDPLTGKRRQANGSGYRTEREAWKACRAAMTEHEKGRIVSSSRRKVADALEEWLTRIEHSIKPSMVQNWRNYAAYYVVPYIGQRDVQDITGAVCDALYAKLLAEGRVKARPRKPSSAQAVHVRRLAGDGREMPCRPYSYDTLRCHRKHAENDPLIGQPIKPRKLGRRAAEDAAEAAQRKLSPGLEPKTVVNTHRMLHRAWEDFTVWGWAKRNIVSDAHPPRVPRKGRKVWTVAQLQRFLQYARSDGFFALWVVRDDADEALVHDITQAAWSEGAAQLYSGLDPIGRQIKLANALKGMSLPLHPGAARFYREQGLSLEGLPNPPDEASSP